LRESPVVGLLEQLIGKGREVRVFDPHIRVDSIYGTNRDYLLNAIPHIGRLMVGSLEELLGWADGLVVAQKPSAEVREKLRGRQVLDLVKAFTVHHRGAESS
jgi:GDP-mannose 6-dehydrogenase